MSKHQCINANEVSKDAMDLKQFAMDKWQSISTLTLKDQAAFFGNIEILGKYV